MLGNREHDVRYVAREAPGGRQTVGTKPKKANCSKVSVLGSHTGLRSAKLTVFRVRAFLNRCCWQVPTMVVGKALLLLVGEAIVLMVLLEMTSK